MWKYQQWVMKLRFKILAILIISTILFVSCQNKQEDTVIDQLDWLVGTWTIETNDYVMYETWEKAEDNTLKAFSYVMVEGDTVFSEIVRIHQIEEDYYMTVEVPDQNEGDEVNFKLVENKDNKLVFENLEHDFPQRIVYENISDDETFAYIEGESDGEYRREDFEFVRVR